MTAAQRKNAAAIFLAKRLQAIEDCDTINGRSSCEKSQVLEGDQLHAAGETGQRR